ncbi:DUF7488 domain-containing protein [Campylobacter sp. RM16192]|uniref:DUF7488 domain-containing protein n=1 Tax=Campylobacter sp. RM16192 TaxID=1660080 RepID=UPI00145218BA|nr:PDZ domain-containing protein [Campylobacter sp. RM16192]QCD51730.1 putative protein (PDZ domain) [Campylobacter sp. RM16192]
MRKIFLILTLCAIIFAAPRPTQDDFNACFEKTLPSIVNVSGNKGIALSSNLIAVPKNSQMPVKNYIKFDPFLGLYLVASDIKLEPIRMSDDNNTKKSDWVSVTSDLNATVYGHVKSLGERLGELDTLTFDVNGTGALLSVCCNMRGIAVGDNKFVPSRYLKHFIAYPYLYYGDVGASFEAIKDKIYVKSVERLGRGAVLMMGDEIVSINGQKFTTLRELNERILFAKKGEILNFEIIRNEVVERFDIPVSSEPNTQNTQKTNLNADKTETKKESKVVNAARDFFKAQGITLDDKLVVKKVDEDSQAAGFGIKPGDKLIQINQNEVKNYKDILKFTSKEKGEYILLFRREGFDFFYKVR